jgi:predicted dienelactone hydrolase
MSSKGGVARNRRRSNRRRGSSSAGCLGGLALLVFTLAASAEPPSRFGVDAPELAHLGAYAVGVRSLELTQKAQPDVLAFDAAQGRAPLRDRVLKIELWYPARAPADAQPVTYTGSLPSPPPDPPATFEIAGLAVRDAPVAGRNFPLLIVSHGYSNDPIALSWLTENLASKGYVVAAIRHEDPFIGDASKFAGPVLRRPLDIAFVARALPAMLAREHLVDPERIALFGYSMGGYGVLTCAGASLDPQAPPNQLMPGKLLAPYVRGGALEVTLHVAHLRAVIAISPAGGGAAFAAWGADGLASISAPLLLIAGDRDHTVDYQSGARAFFDQAVHAHRYLLTFKGAGHDIGFDPAPESMRARLWDFDWFTDPVWRTERVNAINAHFITAFLDRYLKGDESRASYLEVPAPQSSSGEWPASTPPTAFDAYSPGAPVDTVWKGFQRHHAEGLELLEAPPAPAAAAADSVTPTIRKKSADSAAL